MAIARTSDIPLGIMADRVNVFGNAGTGGYAEFLNSVYGHEPIFFQGIVIMYNPQTHTAKVQMAGLQLGVWSCVLSDEALSYSFGFSMTCPPREGDPVLVVETSPKSHSGIIIGRIPFNWCFKVKGDLYNDPDQYHRRAYTQDDLAKKTWDRNIDCFTVPFADPNEDSTHIHTHFRPTDVIPGEFAYLNQHNCGIKGGLFSATLLGGGASLRMSALSNMARLTCDLYLRHSMHGSTHEFHNGRYLSSERNFALYQEERLGGDSPEATVWTEDAEAPVEGEDQTMRPRIKDFSGYFGNLTARYCLRPDPADPGIRVQGKTKPKEEGVSREAVDPSGQYRLSAAGMLVIERTGRIPVPVRKCYPTDKGHDIPNDPKTLTPFIHKDKTDAGYRQLELFDRQAYDLKNQYSRVDGLGVTEPDHYVPQEEEMKPLQDKYDPNFGKNETVKLERYDKRRAGIYVGEDGSVIIRDAWGSEIAMVGGNITLACPGNTYILPGKTALTIGGDDVVIKAQNSVDIHASEHDVRLSAARNMEIIGGGDEGKYSGGVIIESKGNASDFGPWSSKGEIGEDAKVRGITLRTKSQGVVIDGPKVNIRSRKETRIISGDEDIDGTLHIGAKMVRTRAKRIYSVTEKSAISQQEGNVDIISSKVGLYADRNLTLTRGTKTPIPIMWYDIGMNIASQFLPGYDEATKDLKNEKDASGGFDAKALENMVFGFRNIKQCRTDESWTIGGPAPFKLYEPAWVQVLGIYETLKGIQSKGYEENPDWENGRPFPSAAGETTCKYAQIEGLKPKNLTSEGFNRSRETVEDETPVTELPFLGGFQIRT